MNPPITGFWAEHLPALIKKNNFVHKSLCCWALNIAVGCSHACRFCYVPDTSTNKMAKPLAALGVDDPDEEWGNYVFLRPWDEEKFLASLAAAERTPLEKLNADGNRAVMLCTTTDPYMVIRNKDKAMQAKLNLERAAMVIAALTLIRDHSTLNVRILTRSPLARQDFDLMKTFGNRLLFGMSVPTLDDRLQRIYEPHAPGVRQRMETLRLAKAAGIPIYVAVAPTVPEMDCQALSDLMLEISRLDPMTVFHEPINIRAENVARIAAHAASLGVTARTEVFASKAAWVNYALEQFRMVAMAAQGAGLSSRLHPWPDAALKKYADPDWLERCWSRVSEWPGKEVTEIRRHGEGETAP